MFIKCAVKLQGLLQLAASCHPSDSSWPTLSRFLAEVSTERTASDRTDPAPAQHSELEPGPPDCLSILDGIFGTVLSFHGNHLRPVLRCRGIWRHSRSGHSLAAAPRDLLDRRPYFPRECALILRHQQRLLRRHVRLGHDLLPVNDCHCRDRRLVTSRPPPGELR